MKSTLLSLVLCLALCACSFSDAEDLPVSVGDTIGMAPMLGGQACSDGGVNIEEIKGVWAKACANGKDCRWLNLQELSHFRKCK